MKTRKKKKILATSLAATLVLGSVSGVPLSSKGIFQMLGIQTAYAADALPTEMTNKLSAIYGKLTDGEKAILLTAQGKMLDDNVINPNDTSLVTEVWSRIDAKAQATHFTLQHLTPSALVSFIRDLRIFYDPTFSAFDQAMQKSANRETLAELAVLAGMKDKNSPVNVFQSEDLTLFANAFEAELKAELVSKSKSELLLLAASNVNMEAFIGDVFDKVVRDRAPDLKFSTLFRGLSITGDDLMKVRGRFSAKVDPDQSAEKALAAAYIRTLAVLEQGAVTNNGRNLSVTLKVAEHTIPASLLQWTFTNGNIRASTSDTATTFILNNSVSTATTKTSAKIVGTDIIIYLGSEDITLTYQAPSTPGTIPAAGNVKGPDKDQAESAVQEVISTLEGPEAPQGGNAAKKAREAIEETLRQESGIDVSATVTIVNNVAKPSLNDSILEDYFQTIHDVAESANDQLLQTVLNAKPAEVTATIRLGIINASTAEIELSKDLVDQAKANSIDHLAVEVNGASFALDVNQLSDGMTLNITKSAQSSAPTTTGQTTVSDVYTFTASNNGSASLTGEVRLPVPSTEGVDPELLVAAKIENGKLVLVRGKYDQAAHEFVVPNGTLSSYVVIENRVSFDDVASVQNWAGHQIDVAAALGIIDGRSKTKFVPNDKVTRAEFVKMLVETLGLSNPSASESFADVSDDDWFKPYIAAAVQAGIVKGRSADTFEPNALITRAEMTALVSRAMMKIMEYQGVEDPNAVLNFFKDASNINASLKDDVALAAQEGIVEGMGNGEFRPNEDSTRAQAAVIMYRLLKK